MVVHWSRTRILHGTCHQTGHSWALLALHSYLGWASKSIDHVAPCSWCMMLHESFTTSIAASSRRRQHYRNDKVHENSSMLDNKYSWCLLEGRGAGVLLYRVFEVTWKVLNWAILPITMQTHELQHASKPTCRVVKQKPNIWSWLWTMNIYRLMSILQHILICQVHWKGWCFGHTAKEHYPCDLLY